MTNTASGSATRNVIPSEVGWQFVPQYYTFVNEHPERLHLFYNKKSTFIHGVEGEGGKPCHGQQEIHQKIVSLGYNNCKVYIHSVDAQSSADGGIIIQVIGEMSNQNDDWRKFAQTFFLAQQPNGYFVLNDIFRFLKEETVEDDEEQAQQETAAAPVVAAVVPVEPPREPTPPPKAPTPPPAVEEPPTTASDIPTSPVSIPAQPLPPSSPRPNGVHEAEKPPPAPEPVVEKAPPVARIATPVAAPTPPPAITALPPAEVQAPQAAPAQPSQPKTWANLAAANSKKWGAAVAQESRGTSEVASSTPTASGTQTPTTPGTPGGTLGGAGRAGQGQVSPAIASLSSLSTAQCFIKGVTEPISETALRNVLTTRFGAIKDLDIVRSKACAFVEFTAIDAARRAIIASLSQNQGGEGGIWVEGGEGYSGQIRISVETRKERGDRPVPRARPGAPDSGAGRTNVGGGGSGFRGRGGTGRGGRGGGGK